MMRIEPLYEVQYAHPVYESAGWAAYPHQAALLDNWERVGMFLVSTQTGSGKTAAALVPIVEAKENAVFLYPTNALLKDQVSSMRDTLSQFKLGEKGRPLQVYELDLGSEWDMDKLYAADVLISRIEGNTLEQMRRRLRVSTKGEALSSILRLDKPLLFLTNPDTFFLLLTARYRHGMHHLMDLLKFDALVVDEFHLYSGATLAKLLFMIDLSRDLLKFDTTVLLSATPSPGLTDLLNMLWEDMIFISPDNCEGFVREYTKTGRRPVMHEVTLDTVSAGRGDVSVMADALADDVEEIKHLRASTRDPRSLPAVAILNSVQAAMHLEDILVREQVFEAEEIGVYRGLMHHEARSFEGKTVVLGTSAIEVGVDFDCHLLYFQAIDLASFMQRLGRLARQRPGRAVFFGRSNQAAALSKVDTVVSRNELEHIASRCFSTSDAMPWFVTTKRGLQVARLTLEHLVALIPDGDVRRRDLRDRFLDYAKRLGCENLGEIIDLSITNDRIEWSGVYQRINSFRGGLASVRVDDKIEERRREERRFGIYEVDIYTLLSRAVIQKAFEDLIVITGYRRPEIPTIRCNVNSDYGTISVLPRDFRLGVDGELLGDEWVDLLGRDHLYVLVPQRFGREMDWRLQRFQHPRGSIFLDDDALIVATLYESHERGFTAECKLQN